MKICRYCGVILIPVSNWHLSSEKQGHLCCKICKREQANLYYKNNTEKARLSSQKYYLKNPEYHMWDRAKRRAKEKNLEFNLEVQDIIIPEKCPVFNVPFIISRNNEYSPSLDRIDNSKGYIKENIQVISRKANTIKSNATYYEIMQVAKYMEGY